MTRHGLRRGARRALITAAVAAATVGTAGADDVIAPIAAVSIANVSGMVVLTDDEMAAAHGGFEWAGLTIAVGLDVRTYLNGQLALQSVATFDSSGATRQTLVGSQLTLVDMASSRGGAGGIAIPATASAGATYLANAGQTVLIQNVDGALQNILINSAANLTAVQRTDATVTLGNYTAFAALLHAGAINSALGHEIGTFSH